MAVSAALFERSIGSDQGLPQDLSAKYLWAADIATFAAKEIHLERFQFQNFQQVDKTHVHDA